MPSKIIKISLQGEETIECTQGFHSNLSSFKGNSSNMYDLFKNIEEFEVRAIEKIL